MKCVVFLLSLVILKCLAKPDSSQMKAGRQIHWSLAVINMQNEFQCWATLISMSQGFTTCTCAIYTDFMYPEFYVKPENSHKLVTKSSVLHYNDVDGDQERKVTQFKIHPKCASNFLISGLFDFNFAIAIAEFSFEKRSDLYPIELPPLNYDILNETLHTYQKERSCGVLLWHKGSPQLHSTPKLKSTDCIMKLCEQFGIFCQINLQEKALFCVNAFVNSISSTTECDGFVVDGAPYICKGLLMGVVSPSLCKSDIPVIIARIEPAITFIADHLDHNIINVASCNGGSYFGVTMLTTLMFLSKYLDAPRED